MSDNLTSYGKYMFCLMQRLTYPLYRHKWLYYFLAYTWGFINVLVGWLVSLALIITKHKPKRFERISYFTLGKYWGGVEFGQVFVIDNSNSISICRHEYGHTYQMCVLGPFYYLLIGIPSAIRYWYRELIYKINRSRYWRLPDYDDIWFENSASYLGSLYSSK